MNGSSAATPAGEDRTISALRDPGQPRRVAKGRQGYSPEAVDETLDRLERDLEQLTQDPSAPTIQAEEVRRITFANQRGGYDPAEVDALMDDYDDRFAEAENQAYRHSQGEQAWHDYTASLADLVMGRLKRANGERFRRPARRRVEGYFVRDVDDLCNRLLDYFRDAEHVEPTVIREASFRPATRKHAYDEAQVDAFLDTAIRLIHALR